MIWDCRNNESFITKLTDNKTGCKFQKHSKVGSIREPKCTSSKLIKRVDRAFQVECALVHVK
ncbi:hypothetical protein MAR_006789 [Mya arenaria]|uniref:Uncharacterized protein n=1 Tax=Mya arenaria TaxID=6604 RepID=A0ABY7DE20_MYAAR|nr:hypothetical protein MAR_006789 [Mya arenaria]